VVFNDFIKDDFIPEGDGQVASGSSSLPDPVDLDTEEQTLEREQNERDVLEALGEYTCHTTMSVENATAVVNRKTLKGLFIAHKFSAGWACLREWKRRRLLLTSLQSSISQKRAGGLKTQTGKITGYTSTGYFLLL
jgi:hypothetical protein